MNEIMHKEKVWEYLKEFLTPNKNQRFDEVLAQRTRHIAVAVEDTFQEQNSSAVVRSCECFGVQNVHVLERINEFRLEREIARNAHKWLTVQHHSENENGIDDCINGLKKQGYQIIATTPHENDCLITEINLTKKMALFFGREKKGLSQDIMDQADAFVRIPMQGFTESLNVSVAVAVTLHELTQRLRRSNIHWQLSPEEMLDIQIEWAMKCIPNAEHIMKRFVS